MGKKRKASSRRSDAVEVDDGANSKLAFNSWEDVADSEEEYLLNRDKILLSEGSGRKEAQKSSGDRYDQQLEFIDFEILRHY